MRPKNLYHQLAMSILSVQALQQVCIPVSHTRNLKFSLLFPSRRVRRLVALTLIPPVQNNSPLYTVICSLQMLGLVKWHFCWAIHSIQAVLKLQFLPRHFLSRAFYARCRWLAPSSTGGRQQPKILGVGSKDDRLTWHQVGQLSECYMIIWIKKELILHYLWQVS